ncbi:MAG TPA: hypothetical protein VG267_00045, partial [Terracidiphilus sp.]|nr:hypothetical protein [Terracidiphilus sp.]
AQPPNLQPALLMDMDFAIIRPLVQRRMPPIRFLSIGSRLCSTLLSDIASRRCPGASLSLLLHQDVKGTCTPKLLNMLGTRKRAATIRLRPELIRFVPSYISFTPSTNALSLRDRDG